MQTTEAELLHRRVQELESRLGDQGRVLAERDYQVERLRNELDAARKIEADLRSEIATSGSRSSNAVERFRSDIAQLEAQLAAAVEERTKLQREVGTMKRDAESTWAAERVENALLRERINDVAAEVARLTATLEGPGSPIESMLAVEAAPQAASCRSTATKPRRKTATAHPRPRTRSPTASGRCNRPPPGLRRPIKFASLRGPKATKQSRRSHGLLRHSVPRNDGEMNVA